MDITKDDVADFLNSVGVLAECPSCRASNWSIGVDGVMLLAKPKTIYEVFPGDPKHYETVAVICNNCGYVRCHLKDVILEWKQEDAR